MLWAKIVSNIFALANTQGFFCDMIINLQQLNNMHVPKADFDLLSYIRIILGNISGEVLHFTSGFPVAALDSR